MEGEKKVETVVTRRKKDDPDDSDASSGYESDPEKDQALTKALEAKVELYEGTLGLGDEKTLKKIFRLLNRYIQDYMLDIMDALLAKIAETCTQKGKDSVWYIKYIQMLGFCRWKQYRLKEALALFHEQETLVGDNSILCENIGHTYSSIGDYEKAREYFTKGLMLLGPDGAPGRQAGFFYGLGLATERLGNIEGALPLLDKALEGYRKDRVDPEGNPVESSIHAKVLSSIGHMHEKMGNFDEAVEALKEVVRLFRKTVGDTSPLTASALASLGKVYIAKNDFASAQPLLKEALEGESIKDAFQIDDTFNLVNLIKELHTKPDSSGKAPSLPDLHAAYGQYVPTLEAVVKRCEPFMSGPKMGDVGALFKSIGEMMLLAGKNEEAIPILSKAISLFQEVTQIDCTGLIEGCNQLLALAAQLSLKAQGK